MTVRQQGETFLSSMALQQLYYTCLLYSKHEEGMQNNCLISAF